jgi:hypothetical protein
MTVTQYEVLRTHRKAFTICTLKVCKKNFNLCRKSEKKRKRKRGPDALVPPNKETPYT